MGSVRPKSPLRASSRSFCIACGSTEPSSTGRRRRLPRNEQTRSQGSRRTAGKKGPAGANGGGGIPPFFCGLNQQDSAFLNYPHTSPYALISRAGPPPRRNIEVRQECC